MPEWIASRPHHSRSPADSIFLWRCGICAILLKNRAEDVVKMGHDRGEAFRNQEAVDYLKQQQYSDILLKTNSQIDLSNEQNGTDCGSRRCNAVPLGGSAMCRTTEP